VHYANSQRTKTAAALSCSTAVTASGGGQGEH
jgi:hypothetical protein